MSDLRGKITLVTGGTSGFGKATAELFVKEGATVIIASNSEEGRLQDVQKEIGCSDYYRLDVTSPESWDKIHDYISEKYGRLDILLNIAGGGVSIKETVNQSVKEIDDAIKLNLNSVIYGSRVLGKMMKRQNSGTIINFSSVCSKEAWPEWSIYAAAKWGVLGFSKGLYVELQPHNIRVTTLIPAASSTGFQKNSGIGEVQLSLKPENIAKVVAEVCKLPSHVVIEEVTVWGIDQVVVPL